MAIVTAVPRNARHSRQRPPAVVKALEVSTGVILAKPLLIVAATFGTEKLLRLVEVLSFAGQNFAALHVPEHAHYGLEPAGIVIWGGQADFMCSMFKSNRYLTAAVGEVLTVRC